MAEFGGKYNNGSDEKFVPPVPKRYSAFISSQFRSSDTIEGLIVLATHCLITDPVEVFETVSVGSYRQKIDLEKIVGGLPEKVAST